MKISQINNNNYIFNKHNNQNFKGYGARPLDKIVIRNPDNFPLMYKITKELVEISKKYSFKVLTEGKRVYENLTDIITFYENTSCLDPWIQDVVSFFDGKFFYKSSSNNKGIVHNYLGKESRNVRKQDFIAGGNMFFTDNDTIIAGEDEDEKNIIRAYNPKRLVRIPQADFHLDLFIRPLKGNVILAADDNMTLDILKKMYNIFLKDKKNNNYKINNIFVCILKMESIMRSTQYVSTESVINSLEKEGFNVIRVPGRIIKSHPDNIFRIINVQNYMNAIVHEEPNGELVYITNKSPILYRFGIKLKQANALNINMEQIFKDLIKDYVKPENVHFITGSKQTYNGKKSEDNIQYILENLYGGIHCLCLEVPKNG